MIGSVRDRGRTNPAPGACRLRDSYLDLGSVYVVSTSAASL